MDVTTFRKQLISQFNAVLLADGYVGKRSGKGYTWSKLIDDGNFQIGLGFWIDKKSHSNPYFRIDQLLDTEDIHDIRAYSKSEWPPKDIRRSLGVRRSLADIVYGLGSDVWIPIPKLIPNDKAFHRYALWLKCALESNIHAGKKVVQKTHKWESK